MSARNTVLLVDDDADFVEMNRVLLEENGYSVRTACNSRECLDAVSSKKPDLIIMDMMMDTRTEGFNLSRELRNSEYTKNIPLVMITSVNETIPYRLESDTTWLPVDVLIEKPADPSLLLDVVNRILRGTSP